MKKNTKKHFFKLIVMFLFLIYISFIFVKQQITLAAYKNEKTYIVSKINEQKEYTNSLLSKKENINSKEYIEQIAREKLNMFMPNERVYVDVGN